MWHTRASGHSVCRHFSPSDGLFSLHTGKKKKVFGKFLWWPTDFFFFFFATFTFFFQRADYFLADMRKLATFSPTIWCHFKAEDYLLEQLHKTGDKMYLKTLRNTLGDLSSHTNSYISDTVHLYQPTMSLQTSLCFLLLAPPTTDNQSSLCRAAFCSRLPQTPLTKTFLIWKNTAVAL